ncbi:MAG: ribonuclease P protein component [Lachnospiraceae bacterium]|nr:ribonuclease P protein component [Lachnospiraceae bacterium]
MLFTNSLKKNEDFRTVYSKGRSRADRYFVLYVLENGTDYNRLGISVSKKTGNSVVRHRIKRLVKESYRLHEKMFNSGLDIVVIARSGAAGLNYNNVETALLHLLKLHKVYS